MLRLISAVLSLALFSTAAAAQPPPAEPPPNEPDDAGDLDDVDSLDDAPLEADDRDDRSVPEDETAPPPRPPAPPSDPSGAVIAAPTGAGTDTGTAAPASDAGGSDDGLDETTELELPPEQDDEEDDSGFVFGSYGRVIAASDLDGGVGRDADIVTWGPRIDEGTYAELELRRQDDVSDMHVRIVATVAVAGPLFHFDGEFEDRFAIRNLFLEVDDALTEGLALWAGSRMWRGDDVYLFDFWPLDNLNTIGGGTRYRLDDVAEAALVVGLAQPDDPFQRQVRDVVAPSGFTPVEVLVLDRPRLVIGAKATWFPLGRDRETGLKAVLYGEHHSVPAGEREAEDGVVEDLPADDGFLLGAQVGGWMVENAAFANLFVRYARGLAVYDPLGVPFRTGTVIETERAEELLIALSANFEHEWLGVQVGGWFRRFRDADPSVFERAALAEGAVAIRPYVWLGQHAGLSVEGSYQALETTALDERTGNPVEGSAWKLGVIPFFSPYGRGTYTRPHLRVIYSVTTRDEGARALYADDDPRSTEINEHFLGVGAEWWFDSSSYQ